MSQPILQVSALRMTFGGVQALAGVDLEVGEGEIVALIGPNGAGKTTLFNCLTGMYTPTGGDIILNAPGKKPCHLNGLKPNKIVERGLARTFQNIRLFGRMTVLENVMIGRHCRAKSFILGAIFRPPATRREERDITMKSFALLRKVGLADFAGEFADSLSYGAQRRLEIARALATEPALLLLDEPAAGMNPRETVELTRLIQQISADGQAVLLIEHDMKLVMSLSQRIYVMDYGKRIACGPPAAIRANPAVIKAYLGEEDDAAA
ncbi:MAG: ABC transporter ATP-binding protein [Desulfobulbaceae bacterium]|jgi:branched-chain amino acid transport system ATP-binding protein|nr:ABC transporter ATP-binding protein [Desulfobulbaceae bacterium]